MVCRSPWLRWVNDLAIIFQAFVLILPKIIPMKLVSWSMVIVLLAGCKGGVDVKHSDLTGRWNFSHALRNGHQTKMLDEAYFVFHPDKSITSNLFATDERKTFDVTDNKLSVTGKEAFKLDIVNFKKDTMELEGKMGPFQMEFMLIKSQDTLSAE